MSEAADIAPAALPGGRPSSCWVRFRESDLFASFRRSKLAMVALLVTMLFFMVALFAPLISPQNPYDPAQIDLINSNLPPIWTADGQAPFVIGTDDQGRDVLSAVFYGLRLSLVVGILGVLVSGALGLALGLIAGYFGGIVDTIIMRVADVQLTFPAILIALAQIITLLKRLGRERGTAVMLVMHDMGVIAEAADRVAVMYSGRIAEIGPVRAVVGDPLHPYARSLMGAIPTLTQETGRLAQIPGAMPRLTAIPDGCAFHPRCPDVFTRCRVERPDPIPVGEHRVACHLYDRHGAAA